MSTKRTITLFFTLSILFFIDSFILANTSTNSERYTDSVQNLNRKTLLDKNKVIIKTIAANKDKKLQNKLHYPLKPETDVKLNDKSNTANKKN